MTTTFILSADKKQYNVFEDSVPVGKIEIKKHSRGGITGKTLYVSTDGLSACTYNNLEDAKKFFI